MKAPRLELSRPALVGSGKTSHQAVNLIWPSHVPSECPPAEAEAASGIVYRYVDEDPPTSDDFLSLREKQPTRVFGPKCCQASGLSVFRNPRDLEQLRRRVPGYRNALVARARLSEVHGLLKPTPTRQGSSHSTWWIPAGVLAASIFRVVRAENFPEEEA